MLYLKSIKKRKDNQMNLEAKIIKPKLGLWELSRQLGSVTQACKVFGYSRDSFYRLVASAIFRTFVQHYVNFITQGGFIRLSNIKRLMKSISRLAISKQWDIVKQGLYTNLLIWCNSFWSSGAEAVLASDKILQLPS